MYRWSERAPRRRDVSLVCGSSRTGDVGAASARVHPRSQPVTAAGLSGVPGHTGELFEPPSGPGSACRCGYRLVVASVYGYIKQGASFGHSKIAGIRLRGGRAGSGKGAAKMVTEAINSAREAGCSEEILFHGDSAYGNSMVAGACERAGARFSFVFTRTRAVDNVIAAIAEYDWVSVHYTGAVTDPIRGVSRSPMPVAEATFTRSPPPRAPSLRDCSCEGYGTKSKATNCSPYGATTRS